MSRVVLPVPAKCRSRSPGSGTAALAAPLVPSPAGRLVTSAPSTRSRRALCRRCRMFLVPQRMTIISPTTQTLAAIRCFGIEAGRLTAQRAGRVFTMRAVVITGHGPPEMLQVQERRDPPVGPGEVRIAVNAAGINFADTLARLGLYPDAPKPPCVVGYEVAGEVESVGEGVDSPKPGDRVVAGTRFGGHADRLTVPASQALPLPKKTTFEQGAAFPVNYGTAYAALVIMGGLREGDRALIHAAGGGVGTAATQIAKSRGAEVFGTASAAKHDAIRAQGVDHAIDYRTQDFAAEVRRITGGGGLELIQEPLGPSPLPQE